MNRYRVDRWELICVLPHRAQARPVRHTCNLRVKDWEKRKFLILTMAEPTLALNLSWTPRPFLFLLGPNLSYAVSCIQRCWVCAKMKSQRSSKRQTLAEDNKSILLSIKNLKRSATPQQGISTTSNGPTFVPYTLRDVSLQAVGLFQGLWLRISLTTQNLRFRPLPEVVSRRVVTMGWFPRLLWR